jgi:purine-binding chemotaxis protein CheW
MTTGKTAAGMRGDFDQSFALARDTQGVTSKDLIGLELGTIAHAIRLSELAGLYAGRNVAPLPSTVAACIGIAGFRGSIIPVFDLASLLGLPRAPHARWLALAAGAPVAFSFAGVAKHMRVPREAIAATTSHGHVNAFADHEERVWAVVSISALIDELAGKQGRAR